MKTATVRDLRYRFAEIEYQLARGEEIVIRKRRQVIARLLPIQPRPQAYPDFAERQKGIFGKKTVRRTGAELVAADRDRY